MKLDDLAIEHLAMQYALANFDGEPPVGWTQTAILPPPGDHLRAYMERRFGVYPTQQAIKRAEEVLEMVIPDQGDD